jgi:hypothetical protein
MEFHQYNQELSFMGRNTDRLNLTAIFEPIVYKMWDPQRLTTLWAFTAWYRDSFTFLLYFNTDRLCDLVVRVPGDKSRGPGSIAGATRFSEK